MPSNLKVAPTAAIAHAFIERGKEPFISHLRAQILRIAKQPFCQVHAGDWCVWMQTSHEVDVTAQNARFHVVRANHMVRHEEKLLASNPFVMFRNNRR